MRVFRVGDLVRIKKCNLHPNCEWIGKCLRIKEINRKLIYPYILGGCDEIFGADELELVSQEITKEITKSDLKERYICKHRDGRESMFDGEAFHEIKKGKFTGITLVTLDALDSNLKNRDTYTNSNRYDIVEIYKPHYECIGKRIEDDVKEVTMAEVEEKFGCKVKIIKEEN